MSSRIYLDYAAATPMHPKVVAAMAPFYSEMFHNPSALYLEARNIKQQLEAARSDVARVIGAKSSEVIFTAGGTESANLAIKGVMQAHPDGELIVSSVEHDAVRKPAKAYNVSSAPVDQNGIVDVELLASMITDSTVLVSVMYVNNEVGSVQPIQKIASIIDQIRRERARSGNKMPIYLHTDACQAPMYLDCNVARSGVDLMTLNGGKIHGPKQSGILYIRAGVVLSPQVQGGGQEMGYRSGTENIAFAVGFAEALRLSQQGRQDRMKTTSSLRDWFMTELEDRFQAVISGHRSHRVANNIHAVFAGVDNERVLFALDSLGISAAAGSACSASSDTSSHVLIAMSMSDQDARSSIRFSIGSDTTKADLEKTLEALSSALSA